MTAFSRIKVGTKLALPDGFWFENIGTGGYRMTLHGSITVTFWRRPEWLQRTHAWGPRSTRVAYLFYNPAGTAPLSFPGFKLAMTHAKEKLLAADAAVRLGYTL